MPQPRRRFLQQLAIAATALASTRALRVHAAERPADAPGHSAFAACVGRDFTATCAPGGTTVLKLAEVARPRNLTGYPDPARAREMCFTLVFEGDAATPLPEAIYTLGAIGPDAAGIGTFEAFMSPIGNSGRRYQIVFNRI